MCNVVFSFDSMKNCEKWHNFQNLYKLSKYSTSCPGHISKSTRWKVFLIVHTDRTPIEGVQRCAFVRFNEKLCKWQNFQNLCKLSKYSTSCPGHISKSTQRIVFRLYTRIELNRRCATLFSFESMKNCKNDRFFKIHKKYKNSVNIRFVSRLYIQKYTLECCYQSAKG